MCKRKQATRVALMILGLTTAWSAAVRAEEKDPGDKMPTSVLIVNIAGKSREGISVVNRATIAKVEFEDGRVKSIRSGRTEIGDK